MADDMAPAAMFEYYERGGERDRLDEPAGQLESARTRQIIARHLPPPATVADIGGGPGRYCLWLAALGYRVAAPRRSAAARRSAPAPGGR
jgi:2-polyprenyl-3-methyl-5-hydroxy-6-metoxy-1,4-benzoquinol methylase